ncbi:hypothetical protein E4191_14095 [Paracoccus liaowanqingii]|uniref:Uncharacterized protein n=1 Tax=Paracoccus liaowanqingii TaxID=2560053 RepID=A0A4P7HN48_9RHOB|nr:hypothetical protein [Paracoccus liaowanqingii]QBX35699.1 hypothetical protein E4191_14095 [Paracoccus liaowanqingii]
MPQFESYGLKGGVWRGRLTDPKGPPARIVLVQHGEVLAEARLSETGEAEWRVEVDLPAQALGDGIQTLLLKTDSGEGGTDSTPGGHVLDRLTLMAGRMLDDDMTAEISALRAELELVKRELRRLATRDTAG